MLFSSLPFILFFLPLFLAVYFLCKGRTARNIALLIFSIFFYAWGEPLYVLLMIFSIAANFAFALLIDRDRKRSKGVLALATAVNLLIIGAFKYADFALSIINHVFGLAVPLPNLPLPIGISFYTFQLLSYVIDVYRDEVKVQKNILFLGAYLSGFPQLIAGPIVRYETIADELTNRVETFDEFAAGLRRFISGLAKKVLIANTMAFAVDGVLSLSPSVYGFWGSWIAVASYALQIYFDFSGYSDMAIGMGLMMGFHYLENFNYPYAAGSVTDFWRRWHLSLSTFFRDYVYIPLGGNRVTRSRWVFNMLVVWFLTGLWHGASFNFIIWGMYYGFLLIIERFFLSKALAGSPLLGHVYTIAAVLFGWALFRADGLSGAGELLSSMLGAYGPGNIRALIRGNIVTLPFVFVFACAAALSAPIWPRINKLIGNSGALYTGADILRILALIACVIALELNVYNPFIYFNF